MDLNHGVYSNLLSVSFQMHVKHPMLYRAILYTGTVVLVYYQDLITIGRDLKFAHMKLVVEATGN